MTLHEICTEIAIIEEKLANGEIEFSHDKIVKDKLAQATKIGHPADILDDVLSHIGWDVYAGKTPSEKKIKQTISGLQKFQRTFKIDLQYLIDELKLYTENQTKVSD